MRKELADVAKKRYSSHDVINVVYWPDPELGSFPEGKVYARGTMIRYAKFAQR